MQMTGEKILPVPQDEAWAALHDPQILKKCVPGCDLIVPIEDGFDIVVVASVGPVKATFKGSIQLRDQHPPERYRLEFIGQGGAAGHGKGDAQVSLIARSAHETAIQYIAKASVGGKLAQIGSRLVDMAAQKITDEFFTAFERELRAKRQGSNESSVEPSQVGLLARIRAWLRRLVLTRLVR